MLKCSDCPVWSMGITWLGCPLPCPGAGAGKRGYQPAGLGRAIIECQADCCGEAEEGFVSQLGWAELVGTMH